MRRIKIFLKNNDVLSLINNFFSLSLLNVINYAFPLILIPYLTKVLGVENFGKYVFSFAIIQYATLFVSYGFDYSATKYVSINRENKNKLSSIFINVLTLRILISLLCTVIIYVTCEIMFDNLQDKKLYLNGIGVFIGYALTPLWFFQGMEKMKFVTIINFISKVISTLLVFFYIKDKNSLEFVNLFFSVGSLISGVLSIFLAVYIFNLKLIIPKLIDFKKHLFEGWSLFLSTIFMSMYRETNVLMLGAFTDYKIVGYYSAAEKIIKAIQSVISPFTSILYPFFGRKLNNENETDKMLSVFFKFTKYYSLLVFVLVILLYFVSNIIIFNVFGPNFVNSVLNFKILILVVFFGGLNYLLGIVGLINLGFEKEFTSSVFISSIVSICLGYFLIKNYKDIGASLTMVITEILLFSLILYKYFKNKIIHKGLI
jgi:PST family polysaccharide transporter